jgi:hypothetical protein
MAVIAEMEMPEASAERMEMVAVQQTAVQVAVAVQVEQAMFLRVVQESHQIFLEARFFMVPAVQATMVVLVQRQVALQHKALMQLQIVAVAVHTEKLVVPA